MLQIASAVSEFATKLSQSELRKVVTPSDAPAAGQSRSHLLVELISYEAPKTKPRRNLWIRRDGG